MRILLREDFFFGLNLKFLTTRATKIHEGHKAGALLFLGTTDNFVVLLGSQAL